MGREAVCTCQWGEIKGQVTALLEARELILGGQSITGLKRRKIPIANMSEIHLEGPSSDRLTFQFEDETVTLNLGADQAKKWEAALLKPPPSLAQRFGITPATKVRTLGKMDDPALAEALACAGKITKNHPDVTLARVDSPEDLMQVIKFTHPNQVPLWVIYPKGRPKAISEAYVRETLRALGLTDTKVASVSPTLTALRFHPRNI
jgi:hypothetical protein